MTALLLLLCAAERPNVLWIIGEDVGPEFGCYGDPHAHTPNVDALAAEGLRFTRAFTVTPVCSTSRSSLLTGHYAWSFGAHNHRSNRGGNHPLPGGVRLLTHRLRDAGYFTANVRKFPGKLKGTGKTDWNFTVEGKEFDSADWSDLKGHQPFYAQVNFPETHRGGSWKDAQQTADPKTTPDEVTFPAYYPDDPVVRESWAAYYNALNVLDRKVGQVLDQLEADGLADNTVVVFLGDHGRAMPRGKQWAYDSGMHIPFIVRVPEKFRSERYTPGGVDGRLLESIDLTAQTLDWAGLPVPEAMHGRPFLGRLAGPPREYALGGRDRGDETVDRVRTLRDERFRYVRNYFPERPYSQLNRYKLTSYPIVRRMLELRDAGELAGPPADLMKPRRPREELYDVTADPDEVANLAGEPAHRETLLRMRAELEAALDRVGDEGRFPEDPEAIEAAERQMRKAYGVRP